MYHHTKQQKSTPPYKTTEEHTTIKNSGSTIQNSRRA
jgi:hypothetical protein